PPTPEPTPTPDPPPTPNPTPTPNGTPDPNATPRPDPNPNPTPPTGGGGGSTPCTLTVTPGGASIRKNGITSASVTVRALGSLTPLLVTATPSNTTEISVSPGQATLAAGGEATFSVRSRRNNAGHTYQVRFTAAPCTEASFRVTVTN
ncbi:MAG TPA: hypothetical protein VIQ24_11510, partial [Pyrinomonadaceae bacterium]